MLTFYFFISFIIFQSILLLGSLFGLIFFELFQRKFKWESEKRQKIISDTLIDILEKKAPIAKNFAGFPPKDLLVTLEKYNLRLSGTYWEFIKTEIVEKHLFNHAKKWSKSFFWTKRNLAARICLLSPSIFCEEVLLSLINDERFLVWSYAASGVAKIEKDVAMISLIKKMSRMKNGFDKIFLRDHLIQNATPKTFFLLEKLGSQCSKAELLVILDLFAEKIFTLKSDLIEKAITSDDKEIYFAALKLYAHNPQKGGGIHLQKALHDPDENIRAIAAMGLRNYYSDETIFELKQAINDPNQMVQLNAADSLLKSGQEGKAFLENIKNLHPVALYALQFRS